MKDLIAGFSNHLKDALGIIQNTPLKSSTTPIQNVVISGLGGSGIGGTVVAELVAPIANVPIVVNKDYTTPAFINENTLFIACSYSGNTEETIMATKQAIDKGAQIACISSGGQLYDIAKEKGYNLVSMQGGNPPRSMFAYSFTFLCQYLKHYGIAELDVKDNIEASIQTLEDSSTQTLEEAKNVASKLQNKTAILYAVSGHLGIASRWRQQLNENSKMLAWEAEIPEMNHNELVGWEGGNDQFIPVFLRNEDDFARNQKRIEIIKDIMLQKTPETIEIWSKGKSDIEKALYLIHLGDWISFYLSELNQVDIMDIKSIDLLKSELSKLPL